MNKGVSIPLQNTGVGWFRVLQPLRFLKRGKFIKESASTLFDGSSDKPFKYIDEVYMNLCKDADFVLTNFTADPAMMIKLLNLRKRWGFKLIIDIDDNIYAVSADNPAAESINLVKTNIEVCLRACDGVTVSVPMLKQIYAPLNKNIFVNPNGLDFDKMYNIIPKKVSKKKTKKIRIGWRGAFGHKQDLEMIKPVIKQLKKDYDITFVTLGWDCGWADEAHEWVNMFDFPQKLADLKLDMAVVPLINSAYNKCKSNLAILEYSALAIPVVASPTENQKNMPILYAETNFYWYEQLEKLILDKKLRREQGLTQYKFVKENYDVTKFTPAFAKWIEELPRNNNLDI